MCVSASSAVKLSHTYIVNTVKFSETDSLIAPVLRSWRPEDHKAEIKSGSHSKLKATVQLHSETLSQKTRAGASEMAQPEKVLRACLPT